ncbi:hypothetical protein J1N35_021156 [Gossypium stocksii]|uniref:Uncharacterized protein n=1 Tax=Gossypium stocksii TaxID=47602 RepID=A0A9D3VDU4_9ROSI|nr:hypothetical protein J1N35_021156 [Gossypium stocksii]
MKKGVDEQIKPRETRGGVTKIKGSMDDMRETLEEVEGCVTELESRQDQLKGKVIGALSASVDTVQGVFNTIMGDQTEKNDALKAMVIALKEQIMELDGELAICKVALGLQMKNKVELQLGFRRSSRVNSRGSLTQTRVASTRVKELTKAMVKAKSSVELGPMKDKFESSKPIETSNGRGDHEEEHDKNGNGGNSNNGGNGKIQNRKRKPNNHLRGKENEKKPI